MRVTLIIATKDRCDALRETFSALGTIRMPAGIDFDVLTVDNGSTDQTRQCVEAAFLHGKRAAYVYEPRIGKSTALNTALEHARGDILVFIDDDVRPHPEWLEKLVAPLITNECDAAGGAVQIPAHLLRPWMTKSHQAWLASTHYINPTDPGSAVGANFAVARRVLEQVPGFDLELGPGKLGLWEDTLFSSQLKHAGYRLKFVGDAIVEHHFSPDRLSKRAFIKHGINEGRSSAYVAWHWEHAPLPNLDLQLAHYRLRLLAKRLLNPREFFRPEGITEWEMDLCCGIAYAKQLKRESRRAREYAKHGLRKLNQR